jgi:hypothetical protein
MARLSPRAAPRHLVSTRRASPSSPPRLVRVRNPQMLPRTDAGAAAACAAGAAPAADPTGCVGGVRRRRPRFLLTGSGCVCSAGFFERASDAGSLAPACTMLNNNVECTRLYILTRSNTKRSRGTLHVLARRDSGIRRVGLIGTRVPRQP